MAQAKDEERMDIVTGLPIAKKAIPETEFMLDIETLDIRPTAVVLSMGVVAFDQETGPIGHYYQQCEFQTQIENGRTISEETIGFWMRQSDEARQAAFGEVGAPPVQVCSQIGNFISSYEYGESPPKVWANGPHFDMVIMENLCDDFRISAPWHYRSARDCRTIIEAAKCEKYQPEKTWSFPDHHPIGDCLWQIECVREARRRIMVVTP